MQKYRILVSAAILGMILTLLIPACRKKNQYADSPVIELRDTEKNSMDFSAVKRMIDTYDFFDNRKNRQGRFYGNLSQQELKGEVVVLDKRTRLMWMAVELNDSVWQKNKANQQWFKTHSYPDAETLIRNFNQGIGYAGFRDWRIPTLAEAASLLRKRKNARSLFLPALFSPGDSNTPLIYIWTSDYFNASQSGRRNMIWTVSFAAGSIFKESYRNPHFIRLVRRSGS